jgi:hypothetical protein
MGPLSRRKFLVGSSMGVLGLVGGNAATAGLSTGVAGSESAPELLPEEISALSQPILLHVRDAVSGTVEVLFDDRAVQFVDKSLVASVLRATR